LQTSWVLRRSLRRVDALLSFPRVCALPGCVDELNEAESSKAGLSPSGGAWEGHQNWIPWGEGTKIGIPWGKGTEIGPPWMRGPKLEHHTARKIR